MDYEQEMVDLLRQSLAMQQQQLALMQQLVARLGPKRIVRDAGNNIVGVEPIEG
jgi:hypothetical protein